MNKITAIIIDDEPLARQIIRRYLESESSIEVIAECENGFVGFKQLNDLKPDLLFLDIMMPKLTGFEMLELLEDPPVVIFSTAYDQYAIKAFESNAIDYLLKPYTQERFSEAVSKALDKIKTANINKTSLPSVIHDHFERGDELQRVVVKDRNKIHIIGMEKIQYLEAMDDYVRFYTEDGKFLKQQTMKFYENHLPSGDFIRIHRSYIVQVREIDRLELMGKDTYVAILREGTELAISRSGYKKLKEVLDF